MDIRMTTCVWKMDYKIEYWNNNEISKDGVKFPGKGAGLLQAWNMPEPTDFCHIIMLYLYNVYSSKSSINQTLNQIP